MNSFFSYALSVMAAVSLVACSAPDDSVRQEAQTVVTDSTKIDSDQVRIAFIYGDTINAKYNFLKDAQAELEKERKVIENRINRKLRKAEQRAMELQQQAAGMTQMEVQEAQLELQNLDIEIQQFQEKLASDFRKREIELQEEYTERINGLLDEYNEDGTYDVILNFQPGGNLMWINEAYDITDDILSLLNREYEEDLAAASAEKEK